MLWKNRVILILSALPLSLDAAHCGRVAVRQDFIPSAVAGKPFSYPCAVAGPVGGGCPPYSYTCTPPGCVMPAGLSIDAAGLITGTPQFAGSTDTQMNLTGEITVTQGLRVEVIRAESWDSWCPRGHFGGNVSSVALAPNFTTSNTAMAGATNGGLLSTTDYGLTWSAEDNFGPQPIGALAADQCAIAPMLTWAVTLPVNSSWTTDVGPSGNTADLNTGNIYRYTGGTLTRETPAGLPATWTGANRKIRQAYLNCSGPTTYMVASDDEGGVFWRDGSGGWFGVNGNLPVSAGKVHAQDIAYGNNSQRNFAATLISYPDKSVATIYRVSSLTTSAPAPTWSTCGDLKFSLPAITSRWQALAMAPYEPTGIATLIAGTSRGEVGLVRVPAAGGCGTPTAGPGLYDVATQVYPAINGFVIPACYSATNHPVYAYTDGGVFYTPDILAVGARFQRIGKGLLSEEIAAMGLANSATCADNRMILGTRRQGAAFGDLNGFCHGQIRATASLNAIAGGRNFNSPGAQACGGSPGTVPLHAASAGNGIYRATATGREFFTAGDTRELAILDIATSAIGTADTVYALTNSGVYQSGGSNGYKYNYFFTPKPLIKLAGAPTSVSGRAYGIDIGGIYASSTATPWGIPVNFPLGAGATDLAAGGPLTSINSDDEMWIAYATNGLLEFQYIAGVTTIVTQNGLAGLDVRRVAASRIPNAPNAVLAQVKSGATWSLRGGLKDTTPASQITFAARTATGLPTNEEAVQIMVEPGGSGASAHVWVLLPSQGLYYSFNGGVTFTRAVTGLPANYIPRAILPANDYNGAVAGQRDVALLVAGKGVYYSRDGGATFCFGPAALSDVPIGIRSVASRRTDLSQFPGPPPPLQYDDLISAGTDQGVFFSEDNGAHWQNRSPAFQRFSAMMYHPITPSGNALLAGSVDGVWRSLDDGTNWTHVYTGGNVTALTQDWKNCTNEIAATLSNGSVLLSTDNGASFTAQSSPTDGAALDRADGTTCLTGGGPESPGGASAALWMAGVSSGASWSATGSSWSAANGGNVDYRLPTAGGFASVRALGVNGIGERKVLIGHASGGLYRTLDGGDTWRKVSGPGSNLEFTSQNAAALLSTTTAAGGTDVLVGMSGTTNGGVYLSGDGGEHWTQINAGFDPNNLNMSTLVKTSCSTCPVQYYSGTYGSGVYTRTIPVVSPPTITGWCFGAGCNSGSACVTTPPGGPEEGGQPLKLCGTGFLVSPVVELDGVAAAGCSMFSATVITCTGTPPHFPGAVGVRIRNTDTRVGVAGQNYTYAAGAPRVVNSLLVAKSGNNANLSYTCTGCTAPPPRVYRSQNAPFTLNVEQYTGGATSYSNTGALAAGANATYFWSIE